MFSNWELTVGGLKVMQHALAIASLHGLVLFPGSSLHMGEPKNEGTNQALDSFIVLGKYITYSLWYRSMMAQMRASVCFSFPS